MVSNLNEAAYETRGVRSIHSLEHPEQLDWQSSASKLDVSPEHVLTVPTAKVVLSSQWQNSDITI